MTTHTRTISRREFLRLSGAALGGLALSRIGLAHAQDNWRDLLPYYEASTRRNIVEANGRRAIRSAKLYPGMYIRDGLFWGPLALDDLALGFDCYQAFAETQFPDGQIRSAVPLSPDEAGVLEPQDDEGGLLFVLASDWLARHGYQLDTERIERAYTWVQGHVRNHTYISPPGPFRYWADTLDFSTEEAISHNQGLLCLARRAMVSLGLGGVTEADVAAAQEQYRAFYTGSYVRLGRYSNFAWAMDNSSIFPEFLSRYLYGEPILPDQVVLDHVGRLVEKAAVYYDDGRLAGIKIVARSTGEFLPAWWFFAPSLNSPGDYQNGGYWPMYTIVALALAYKISADAAYEQMVGQLVINELAADPRSKEIIKLVPGEVGTYDPARTDYTWNALIKTACVWSGLA
jgi:hypothetical protein